MKKNTTLLLLVVFSLTLLLSGCGKKKTEVNLEDDQSQECKIIWYSVGDCNVKDLEMVNKEVNKYLKEKLNCTLEYRIEDWGAYDQKMMMTAQTGDPWDICFTAPWAMDARKNIPRKLFLPLDELIEKFGQDMAKTMPKDFLERAKFEGRNYLLYSGSYLAGGLDYEINKNFVDKYKIDLGKIKALGDWIPVLQQIQKAEPGITPINDIARAAGAVDLLDYVFSDTMPGAVKMNDKECKVINQFEDKEYVENYLMQARKFYDLKLLPQDISVAYKINENFPKGKCVVTVAAGGPGYAERETQKLGFPVVTIPAAKPFVASTAIVSHCLAVNNHSKNPARVMKFLNLLYTDPYLKNLLLYGIEGVHYTKVDGKRIKFTDRHKDYLMFDWELGNNMIDYIPDNEPADMWAQCDKIEKEAIVSPIFGFMFNPDPVLTQVASITNIAQKYVWDMRSGLTDPQKMLPELNSKMKEAGLDQLLAEMQKQIDAWRKTVNK